MPSPLRIAFAGTPDFAAEHLRALLDSPHNVVCVYTQPDRPAGRGRRLTPSPVKALALEHGLPVHQPERLKTPETHAALIEADIDVLVVVAYGLILPRAVLDIPRMGAINVHASLLPRWRGAAPIQRAIEAGDPESGVTIMAMDEGLDTGDMLLTARLPIEDTTTAAGLHDQLAEIGTRALVEALDRMSDQQLTATPQPDEGVTYAAKLSKAEARLDFSQSATVLAQRVRAFNPFPVAWTTLGGDTLRLWHAEARVAQGSEREAVPGQLLDGPSDALHVACGEGVLHITHAQLPGGKMLSAHELLNSRRDQFVAGTVLGADQ
ncbi:methionyl-tRNA formyltransferase [Kushneria konosiri]|uniref:Methionyl-tRNA formyltransferase n=1 Tax=Kushneria konosiri TaxID=698828 RepID=A0A2Z2H6U1_9GAMM|nr:methionyl-tRNA formyltransferase [Kushneria konosiri]ARS53153.1 methionyl-tRNA formyltransferase [Kushneria konosiri]